MRSENIKTLLLVEDEAIIAIAQKKTLERYGYKVITANNGEQAFETFVGNSDIDLILMDIDLGKGIDGTVAAKRILAERNIPIVFLSSHTEPEIVEKTEKITSYGYVVKNSGITVLDASIKMAFKLFDANKQIVESEIKQKAMISNISDVIGIIGADGIMKYKSPNIEKLFGWKPEDLIGTDGFLTVHPDDLERIRNVFFDILKTENFSRTVEYRYKCKDGSFKHVELTAINLTDDPIVRGILLNYHDITERKTLEDALEKRVIALTRPLDQPENIVFEDLFDREVIQRIQDEFAMATGVASLITTPEGIPITRPSNFTRLCSDIIRCTEKGRVNCYNSDAIIGRHHPGGPIIQPCLSGGLWDAGASITVGEKHIANWLIGQVRDDTHSAEKMREYAREIGADEDSAIEAFNEIKKMPIEQFNNIARALYTLANQLSAIAYQNIQQARFITERRRAEEELKLSEERFRKIFEEGQFGTAVVNKNFFFENVNPAFCMFTGYSQKELQDMTFRDITHPGHLDEDIENIQKLKNGEISSYQTEKRYVRKNGDILWGNVLVSAIRDAKGKFLYFLAIIIDITERKTAEEALKESEHRYRSLFNSMTEGFALHDIVVDEDGKPCDYRFLVANPAFEQLTGLKVEDIIGKLQSQVLPGEDPYWLETYSRVAYTGEPVHLEHYSPVLKKYFGVFAYCPTAGQFAVIFSDITERKQAEEQIKAKSEELEALNEELNAAIEEMEATNEELNRTNTDLIASEEKLRHAIDGLNNRESRLKTLLQAIPDLVWLKDKDGVYLSCNRLFERFFGAEEQAIIGKTDYDFMDRELAEFFRAHDRRAMEAGKPTINEEWITYADDGHRAYLETIKTPMYDEKGKLIGVLGIGRDITARKQAREDLLKGEVRYLKAQRMGHVGNWEYNLQTTNFWGSDEARRIYGFDSEQFDFTTDEVENCIPERERVHQALIDLIENGKEYNLEFEIHPRNGSEPRIISSIAELQRDENGNPFIVTGVIQDITERKRIENELIQSKRTLDAMLQTMAEGMVTADLNGTIVYSNQAAGRILGIGKDLLGRDYKSREWRQLDENGDPYPIEQLPLAIAMREQREVLNVEHQIEASDGERKWLSVNAAPLCDEAGHLSGGIASFRDITENKRLIEEINRSRSRFEQLIQNSSDTIVILDEDGIQRFVSDAVEQTLGYKPEEVTDIPVIKEMIHPEDIEKTQAAFMEIISKGYGGTQYRHRHKNGGWIHLEGWGTNQLDNPDIRGVVVSVRDITERKRFEEEIQLDEARLESLLKVNQHSAESIQDLLDFTLDEAIALTGSRIGYIYFYDEKKKEFSLNTWSKDVMKQCAVVEKQAVYQLDKTGLWGEAVRQRRPILDNDFSSYNALRKGLPEGHNPLKRFLTIPVISNEEIVAVVGVANKEIDYNESDIRQLNLMMDAVWKIVQRKKVEEQLSETRDYLDNLLNYANAPIIVWDDQYRITKFNKAFERISGRSEAEVLGEEVSILFPPGSREKSLEYIRTASAGNRWEVVEIEIQHIDGTVRTLLWNSAVIYSSDGSTIAATIAQGQDITERKKAEGNVQRLLREKELLLQEVHHRIKNNMNTIKGLLSLQADAQKNPEIADVLFDAENRVISMMVLYDRLYRSGDYRAIQVKEYIPALADEILSNFPSGKKVKIVKNLDDFELDVRMLQPLGIIINELITNIMKYAFTGRDDGEIKIAASVKDNHAIMTVQDNGVGIPESVDFNSSTGFGLNLVRMLTEQIGGTISIERGSGTKFILEFDVSL